MRIDPAPSFRGRFQIPGDKAISHRAAILGGMAEGLTRIHNFASAADCASTLACLRALGVEIERRDKEVVILGRGFASWRAPAAPLDAGNSGTTLRMMAGALAGRPFRSVLTGDESLCRRPVERVAAPLRLMGVNAVSTDGKPPLTLDGGTLRPLVYDSPVASAQVKTAVLLAGLQADGITTVREPAESRDHTERMLPLFGVPVERSGRSASVRGVARLHGAELTVPGDASGAAFPVVAALVLPDSEVRLDGVLLSPGRAAFLDVLQAMGARIETGVTSTEPEPVGWITARSSRLRGVAVDPALVPALIDEVPALAVAAAFADGTFTVSGAQELRVKETDRIAALVEGLTRMGGSVEERADGLLVHGGRPLHGAAVRSFGDHRIAMAFAVAALAARGPTEIEDAECASVSFPEFYGLVARAVGRA